MLEILRSKLEEEKRKKKEVISVLDKRIKSLEKAISGIASYNQQTADVKSTLANYEISYIEEIEYED